MARYVVAKDWFFKEHMSDNKGDVELLFLQIQQVNEKCLSAEKVLTNANSQLTWITHHAMTRGVKLRTLAMMLGMSHAALRQRWLRAELIDPPSSSLSSKDADAVPASDSNTSVISEKPH